MDKKQANLNNLDVIGTNAIPVSEISNAYDRASKNLLNQIHKYGVDLANLTEKVDTERKIIDLRNKSLERRVAFAQEYKNPANVNFSNEDWENKRNEAFKKLKEEEINELKLSGLNNTVIEKEEANHKEYYLQEQLNYDLDKGQWTKKNDITNAEANLTNYTYLAYASDNTVESDTMIDNINKNISILKKYGISDEVINQKLVTDFNNRIKEEVIKNTQQELRGANTSNWGMVQNRIKAKTDYAVQKSLSMVGKIGTLKDTTTKDVFKLTIEDNLKLVDSMLEQKNESLEYRAMREREALINKQERIIEKQKNQQEIIVKTFNNYIEDDNKYAESGDIDNLILHRTSDPFNPQPKVLPFEFSDKIYGDDYNYIAGKTVFGTKDEPKVISLEDIGKGKAYETYDLLQGEILDEYKEGLTNLRTNKASNLEIKEYTKNFIKDKATSEKYDLDMEKEENMTEGAVLSVLKQVGYDPKKFTGDIVSKNRVEEQWNDLNKNNYYDEAAYINAIKPYLKGEKEKKSFFKGDKTEAIKNVRNKLIKINGGTSSELVDRVAIKYVLSEINKEKDLLKDLYAEDGNIKAEEIINLSFDNDTLNGTDNETLEKDLKALWDMNIRGVNYRKAPIKKITMKPQIGNMPGNTAKDN